MPQSSGVQLVIFDLGRVLIRICNNWREACGLAGIHIPADLPSFDAPTAARDHEAIVLLDTNKITLEQFAERVAPHRGIRPQDVIAAYDVFLREPYPGAVELLDDLHAAGLKTACLSNTSAGHWRQMFNPTHCSYFPLDRLTHRFASHLIGTCKPSDAIYEHVERTAGLSGDRIVFFDDLEENVTAAVRRGWRAHHIRLDADPIVQARAVLAEHGLLR